MSCEAPRRVPELELLEPDDVAPAPSELPRRRRPDRPEPDDRDVDAHRGHACPSRGSSQRRMSSAASSIGANHPWVNARDDMPRCTDSQTAQS